MLQLVLGRAGTGKTEWTRREVVARCGNGPTMLLVPEQFTMETEKQLLSALGGSMPSDLVQSFSGLSRWFFLRAGGNAGEYLDDFGRTVLMSRAAERVADALTLYRRQREQPSFLAAMLNLSGEMKSSAVPAETLLEVADSLPEGTLRAKLADAGQILTQYEALVRERYHDGLDDLTLVAAGIREHRLFAGYTVFVDGFHSFSRQEQDVLREIMRQAEEVYVTLPCAAVQDETGGTGLFSNVQQAARRLLGEARRYNVDVRPALRLTQPYRFHNPNLAAVEADLFSGAPVPRQTAEGVRLTVAASVLEEVEAAARQIHRDVRESGGRCGECAVIVRSLADYDGVLQTVFEKYGIPYFLDERQDVSVKPPFALVLAALRLACGGWRTEDFFRCLKTGFFPCPMEDVFLLENYARLWNLHGDALHAEYTLHPGGYVKDFTDRDRETLRRLNAVREAVAPPLLAFCEALRGTLTGHTLCLAIYDLLRALRVPEQLEAQTRQAEGEEARPGAQDGRRLWTLLVGVLDQLHLALEEDTFPARRALELVRLAFAGADLGHIPPTADCVVVGAADRIRIPTVRRVYLLGVNEGVFPRPPAPGGILTPQEKEKLARRGVEIGGDLTYWAVEEMFIAYKALCAASETLHVFYRRCDALGAELRPSPLVALLRGMFPTLAADEAGDAPLLTLAETEEAGFAALLAASPARPGAAALRAYYETRPAYAAALRRAEEPCFGPRAALRDTELAAALFGREMRLSATKLESYHKCRFAFFCKYGLRARPLDKLTLRANDVGTFVHFVLENVLKETREPGIEYMDAAARREEIERWMRVYFEEYMGGEKDKSARFLFLFSHLSQLLEAIVDNIAEEMAQSAYAPEAFELSIGREGEIQPVVVECPDGGRLMLEGMVDRVDVMRHEGKTYLRVIDYKTGAKKFQLSDVLSGLNMQMLLYLLSIWRNGAPRFGEVVPAGVLYFPALRPSVSAEPGESEEETVARLKKKFCMNGLLTRDETSLTGMEAALDGVYIPVKADRRGGVKSGSLATLEQLGRLARRMERLLREMHRTLMGGDIAARPAKGKTVDACQYCDYRSICGYEEGLDPVREVPKRRNEEVWQLLEQEEAASGGAGDGGAARP